MGRGAWRLRGKVAEAPPDPSEYPLGVVAAGLQSVFDMRASPPMPVGATKTIAANAGSLPPLYGYSDVTKVLNLKDSAPASLDGWAFTGVTHFNDSAAKITYSNCSGSVTTSENVILCGVNTNNGTGAHTEWTDSTFDLSATELGIEAPFRNGAGTLTLTRISAFNTARNFISGLPGAVATNVTDSYFKGIGQQLDTEHAEAFHIRAGTLTMTRVFLDFIDDVIPLLTWTATVFPQSRTSAMSVTIEDSILAMPTGAGNYNLSFGQDEELCEVTLINCVLNSGTSAYLFKGPNGRLYGGPNYDYDTGAVLDLPYD